MNKEFYAGNRKSLYQKVAAGSLGVVFSGDRNRAGKYCTDGLCGRGNN